MKLSRVFLLSLLLWSSNSLQAQDTASSHFIFLPPGLHFTPLKANIEEPRIGVYRFFNEANMKVDIGNTIDVVGFSIPASQIKMTAGIDFMAYAFVTDAQGLRLQIDAIDGFFGGNMSLSKKFSADELQTRLRILHHSAHLADGHYSVGSASWLNNRKPIAFTQDFGELTVAYVICPSFGTVRPYGGITYATLIRPSELQRLGYDGGIECFFNNIIGSLFEHQSNIFCAYHISMWGTPVYAATHQIQAGIKFGQWREKGITLYLAYYNGRHMFAEYFNERQTTLGIGFTIDFF